MKPFCFLFLLFLLGCNSSEKETLFTALSATETGVDFENTIIENDTFNLIDYNYVYNGGGVAVGDLNNDGFADLYFSGNQVGDKLYINKGKNADSAIRFEDVTEKAGIKKTGWSTGVTMADVNGDGLLDIYVCKSGNYPAEKRANQLYINQSDLKNNVIKFKESAQKHGLTDTTFSTQAAFFDYDKDNDLDMFLITSTNNIRNPNALVPPILDGLGSAVDKLYENNGKGFFTDISKKAGILQDGLSLGLSIADVNGDGWEDIFVGNDFLANDLLYLNNRNGTFTESAKEVFQHHGQFTMGSDIADFNNDGKPDLMTVDMLPADNEQRKKMAGPANYVQYVQSQQLGYHPQFMRNMLQLNVGKTPDGKVHFSEIGQLAGIHSTDWSWSPLFADFDNDGLKDLFITNGYLRDITDLDFVTNNAEKANELNSKQAIDDWMKAGALKMNTIKKTNFLFHNNNDLTFKDISADAFGDMPSLSNGAAFADLDNDGDLDLITNNINEKAFILRNNHLENHYLKVKLEGNGQNKFGVGSTVTIFQQGKLQTISQSVCKGFQSSSDYILHFGLNKNQSVDSLIITWTDGKTQIVRNPKTDQLLILSYKNSVPPQIITPNYTPYFTDISDEFKGFIHQEEPYMDFNQEALLMHKLSEQGPKMTVGDVNGDNLEDFFVGGSYLHEGVFFIQNQNGKYSQKPLSKVKSEKNEEDVGVLLFDADNDSDLDLYIVSGSNEYYDGSEYFQDRLYLNDSKGNFSLSQNRLPKIQHSGSCVIANDFDHDGDLDLFRGGRLTPIQYPKPGESYLLRNDKGIFKDVSETSLKSIGMVTSAVWADYNNDSWTDLLVVGEFMPLTLFENKKGILTKIEAFSASNGLWNCVKSADFDRDGDLDFIAGNMGLNSRYQISKTEPLTIYSADYDENSRWDAIMSYYLKGKEYPVHPRDELMRQIPLFKTSFSNYSLYAKATINEILSPQQIKEAEISKAYLQESCYIENLGKGKFKLIPLPKIAQWSVIQDILIDDIDKDGNLDVLLVGNDYSQEPVAGRYDAFFGAILKGNGKGKFEGLLFDKTGFFIDGDCRNAILVKNLKGQKDIIVSRNASTLKAFKIK